MSVFDPFEVEFWIPVGVAVLCGTIIGMERQVRGKPAGVRTSTLICLSTMIFVRLGAQFASEDTDPARVLAQLVTGVGFLGAGVIIAREGGAITGVTTAAVVWILSALGATIGLGYHEAAIAFAVTTVLILIGVELLESSIKWLAGGVHRRGMD